MTDITADEYRTAAKVDRHHGGQSAAQFYEDNARALESKDLVTQVAMQFAGSTWGGRDAEEQFALTGSERALAYLVGAGRLIPAGGMALTPEQVEDVRLIASENYPLDSDPTASINRLRALFPATEPAEERCRKWTVRVAGGVETGIQCVLPAGHVCFHDYVPPIHNYVQPAPAEPAEEETKAEGPCEYCNRPEPSCHAWRCAGRKAAFERSTASSPVVPTPNETGPWETAEAIPKGVMVVTDRDKRTWKYSSRTDGWMHRSHGATHWVHGYPDACFAPFVAAEEG